MKLISGVRKNGTWKRRYAGKGLIFDIIEDSEGNKIIKVVCHA